MPLPGNDPIVTGSSSTPGTPKSVSDLASLLYGVKGTSAPVGKNNYGGTGLEQLLQNPATKNGNAQTAAGVKQAGVISANTKYATAHGITATEAQLSNPNFIANHPISAVKTAATSSGGGGSSGLASPSSLASLAAMAGGGAPSATTDSQAKTLIDAQYQPLLDELNRQLKEDQTVYGQQSAQVKADQARLDSNTQAIYSLLRNQISGEQKQSDQQYGQTEQHVGGSFDQLLSRLNEIYGHAGQQLSGDMNQLGLGNAAENYGNHSLVDNYNLLTGLANTDKTATMGNLTTEGQGFHTLLGSQATQATATGDDQQSAIDTLSAKELIQLKNNLQNQITQINTQKANINTEKGQQIAAMKIKLQSALNQTNNQLAIAEAKLQQGQQRIDISKQSLAQRINQNTFSDQLALQKLNKAGGTAKQNTTKLGNAETTLTQLMPNTDEAGAAFAWLTGGGKTSTGHDILTLLLTNGAGGINSKLDLEPEANALSQKFGGDPKQTLQALQLALLSLGGYGHTG